jgi:hypothetical protein
VPGRIVSYSPTTEAVVRTTTTQSSSGSVGGDPTDWCGWFKTLPSIPSMFPTCNLPPDRELYQCTANFPAPWTCTCALAAPPAGKYPKYTCPISARPYAFFCSDLTRSSAGSIRSNGISHISKNSLATAQYLNQPSRDRQSSRLKSEWGCP